MALARPAHFGKGEQTLQDTSVRDTWEITPEQVAKLRDEHAIYMADTGRFNVCGMADEDVDRFCEAVLEAMDG